MREAASVLLGKIKSRDGKGGERVLFPRLFLARAFFPWLFIALAFLIFLSPSVFSMPVKGDAGSPSIEYGDVRDAVLERRFSESQEYPYPEPATFKGLYVEDPRFPPLTAADIGFIVSAASAAFREQFAGDALFVVVSTCSITDLFENKEPVIRGYFRRVSGAGDLADELPLKSILSAFEHDPFSVNRKEIGERVRGVLREIGIPLKDIRKLVGPGAKSVDEAVDSALSIYEARIKRLQATKNADGVKLFSRDTMSYYSLPQWRIFVSDRADVSFVLTNAPLLDIGKAPSIHALLRGGLVGGSAVPDLEGKAGSMIVSSFLYKADHELFLERDLRTVEDKNRAVAYALIMEVGHVIFNIPDDYGSEGLMRPAVGFKFGDWVKRARLHPVSADPAYKNVRQSGFHELKK
jgi:hypothetical protein